MADNGVERHPPAQDGYTAEPTQNVRDLLALSMERADRLREAETVRLNEMIALRAVHENELRVGETARIDTVISLMGAHEHEIRDAAAARIDELIALRAAHENELRIAEAKRIDAIRVVDVNAVSVANERATAQAAVLATQVALSAETLRALVATTATAAATQVNQMNAQLMDRISLLEKSQYEIRGTGTGKRDLYGWIVAGISTLFAIITALYGVLHH